MPTLAENVGAFGIDSPEVGIYITSLDYEFKPETVERRDHTGRVVGVKIYDEAATFSMTGGLPLGSNADAIALGKSLVLANTPPNCWSFKTTATTSFVDSIKISRKNTELATLDVGGKIYSFGAGVQSLSSPVIGDDNY